MHRTTLTAGCAVLLLSLAACSGGNGEGEGEEHGHSAEADVEPVGAFGPGCADFPDTGPGSLSAMADRPLSTAIADNPFLGRLAEVVERSGLASDLDTADDMTLFAPTDDAFDMYPTPAIQGLLDSPDGPAHLLGHHVVLGEFGSADLDGGSFDTLNGDRIRATADEGEYTVDGYAPVVCADVRTTNATVHVVGMLLIPS
ncbi:fasciclin domain-containing protein [Nocardiopsis sp. NPDC006832]|uniref:fasciclin domain-containing protein n=1 Tax=Nocardiopsis sp. NPDC006832 TaxID=3157188 RepID=UPI0033F56F80